jgi:hypothetical protein
MAAIKGIGPIPLSYFQWVTFKHPSYTAPDEKKMSIPHVAYNVERRCIVPELAVDG